MPVGWSGTSWSMDGFDVPPRRASKYGFTYMSPCDPAPPADPTSDDPFPILTKLRDAGWSVAIHNDYWQNGVRYTFWLFTNKDTGRYVKGEAHTDFEALTRALALAEGGR